ncbi:hypothetical protein G7077_06525 [Sphingomonas piscis]|uniref:LysR family transcriptional regulator n=1 Tax=Sphingomonas piscis TaxID=2714943 RepID=A0A6G7YPD3_9SPHN|nr:hypothetical protein [Sphingomonas piscis]QIK78599.1 hypothetical protein G7077_06525 [Sphingomonas piscis]
MSYQRTKPLLATPPRSDGWTAKRHLRFLTVLLHTGNVRLAAECVGMTRESAYRLRSRDPHGLFAHIWKKAIALPAWPPESGEVDKGHTRITLDRLATEGSGDPRIFVTTSTS